MSEHRFAVSVAWTGDRGEGTATYRGYGRDHEVSSPGVPTLLGSAHRTFHGDADRWNPELLLVAALSECHMLSYLHVCVRHDVVVTGYDDDASGSMRLNADGSGEFTEVTLRPRVRLADPAQAELATTLHGEASRLCFIARSVAFPVHHEPAVV
ncbi:OsmC family protein [Tersicoccus sp. MR15.9]|uniref:OsmC family protein n=1 Tax=Tersicoccus mangrovi TaxID=3121635 RepID=UPI002FE5223A